MKQVVPDPPNLEKEFHGIFGNRAVREHTVAVLCLYQLSRRLLKEHGHRVVGAHVQKERWVDVSTEAVPSHPCIVSSLTARIA
jgi:hypothetical protein